MYNKNMESTSSDLTERILQLYRMANDSNQHFSRKEDLRGLTKSLKFCIDGRNLPAEANPQLAHNIGELEKFFAEEKVRDKNFGEIKAAIGEFIKAS